MESEVLSAIILGLSKVLMIIAPDRLEKIKRDIDNLTEEYNEGKQELAQAIKSGDADLINKCIRKLLP